ncbi:MAG: YARHG domain-containing protein, partial [Clostridia bacterium]|nr:YARHG domain-containing protein [Clostridia bacterium]
MKNCMWKRIAMLVMAMTLLMGGLGIPKAAHADGAAKDWDFYLIPDSDTRVLTKEEIWKWDYESLWYLINEIFAR